MKILSHGQGGVEGGQDTVNIFSCQVLLKKCNNMCLYGQESDTGESVHTLEGEGASEAEDGDKSIVADVSE